MILKIPLDNFNVSQVFRATHFLLPTQQFLDIHKWDTIDYHDVGLQVLETPLTKADSDIVDVMLQDGLAAPFFLLPSLSLKLCKYFRCDTYINILIPFEQTKRHQYAAPNYDVSVFLQVKFIDLAEDIHTLNHSKTECPK